MPLPSVGPCTLGSHSATTRGKQIDRSWRHDSTPAEWQLTMLSRPFPVGILTNALPAGGVMASKPGQ